MRIQNIFQSSFCRRFSLSASGPSRRLAQGPWLTREIIPNKGPVLVIDYKDLADSKLDSPELNATKSTKAKGRVETDLLTDFRHLASFNWCGSIEKPIMVIPGASRRYRKSWAGGEVVADVDERIVSKHMHLIPSYPMESLFVAVQKCAELENISRPRFGSFDIATDRIILRRLFEFCRRRGSYPRAAVDAPRTGGLRVDVERLGDRLIVFSRCEPSIYDVPAAHARMTFGEDFRAKIAEEAPLFSNSSSNRLLQVLNAAAPSSTNPLGSQCHIASYRFGDLRMLLRFNVSCVDMDKSQAMGPQVPESEYEVRSIPGSNISCVHAGQRWNYHTMELTTRRSNKGFPRYKWTQLYFSQTRAVVIGWYDVDRANRGVVKVTPRLYSFEDCQRLVGMGIRNYDDQGYNEATAAVLHNLLYRIVDFVRCQPNGKKYAVIWPAAHNSQLKIFEKRSYSTNALPDYLQDLI